MPTVMKLSNGSDSDSYQCLRTEAAPALRQPEFRRLLLHLSVCFKPAEISPEFRPEVGLDRRTPLFSTGIPACAHRRATATGPPKKVAIARAPVSILLAHSLE